MDKLPDLRRLFYPQSLAMVGASREVRKSGGLFLKSLLDCKYAGRLYPINPSAEEILGLRAYPSLAQVPEAVDLAILTVPAPAVLQAMEDCARAGVKFVIVHTAGFSESGPMGRGLEERVLETARRGGIRIIGPNCMGLFNPRAGINTIVAMMPELVQAQGGVAFVSQSGWVAEEFMIAGYYRGLGFSQVVSVGNQNDLQLAEFLEYYASDPETAVVGAYVEGLREGRPFLEAVQRASRHKPVIIWKGGRTPAGARAALSHTGSLAGRAQVFTAALRQGGALLAEHLAEVVDLCVAFSAPRRPRGRRVGVLTESGGGAVANGDALEACGLEMPVLGSTTQRELRDFLSPFLPPSSGFSNPVDLVWPPAEGYSRIYPRCLELMAPEVDILLLFTYRGLADESLGESLARLGERLGKPLYAVAAWPDTVREGFRLFTRKGVPAFITAERAARAISAVAGYALKI